MSEELNPTHCTFCGKHSDYVAVLIAAPKAAICEECVATCVRTLVERLRKSEESAA